MKKIGTETFAASKLSETGSVEYCLWVDSVGSLYFQIIGNEASGTFSNYLFSVSKYQSERASTKALGNLDAYNIELKKHEIVKDNNNGAFLKAVLRNLLPEGDAA
jgi:hypothetical protein